MPEPRKRLERGLVQVYTGDGKGKTTAALGLAFRAIGHDLKVIVVQFMKGNIQYGELETARRLAKWIEIRQMGRETFVSKQNPAQEDTACAKEALALARQVLAPEAGYDLVILDEINVAENFALIELRDVKALIAMKPPQVELVLTGRYANPEIIAMADLVTEMKLVKHYFDAGVEARTGIEL